MKKALVACSVLLMMVTTANAADFAPSMLKLSANPIIQYDFDGSQLKIPAQVSGTPAGIVFCVFTRGIAGNVAPTQNGFLGWHYVNKIDTCVYYSPLRSYSPGAIEISWDGKDQDGGVVPAGEYTYYLWAFDNQTPKQLMSSQISYTQYAKIQEVDEEGIPLTKPVWYTSTNRWMIGNDPMDSALLETSARKLASGWAQVGAALLHPTDFDYFYLRVVNNESETGALQKLKWVPGGDAEIQTDFGDGGYSETFQGSPSSSSLGVVTNGEYLYTSDRYALQSMPNSEFYIFGFDGYMVDMVDLTKWWSRSDEYDKGVMYNGGPSNCDIEDELIFWNHFGSCMVQMVDPIAYLDSADENEFFRWTNDNGDYVHDHNFEETAALPWVCFDFNVGPYSYTITTDDNHFTATNAYDVGAVSFGLFAPDGTGIGYFAFAGETAGWKRGTWIVDSNTPYDGLYCDNMQSGGTHYDWNTAKVDLSMYYIGHDSISGIITNAVAVESNAPEAFAVEQNTPNPFNPSTTISFSTTAPGSVKADIFAVSGQKVATVADGFMETGRHSVVWDASGFSAGIYFCTIESGGTSKTIKMTLVK